jgi:hypothetical protein
VLQARFSDSLKGYRCSEDDWHAARRPREGRTDATNKSLTRVDPGTAAPFEFVDTFGCEHSVVDVPHSADERRHMAPLELGIRMAQACIDFWSDIARHPPEI